LGIGDWGLDPIPNPQSPIPKYTIYIAKLFITNITLIYNTFITLI